MLLISRHIRNELPRHDEIWNETQTKMIYNLIQLKSQFIFEFLNSNIEVCNYYLNIMLS